MKYVFPEYKENVVLGNGKLQLNRKRKILLRCP